jgi:integrase
LKGWQEACERAGVPGLLFHDLRRSAIRNMTRAGIPRPVAMAISGHKTESVYRRYDIVSGGDLEAAGTTMERFMREQRTPAKLERVK